MCGLTIFMFIITRVLFGNISRKSLDKLNDMVPLLYSSARHSIGCLAKRNIYRYPFMGVLLVFLLVMRYQCGDL